MTGYSSAFATHIVAMLELKNSLGLSTGGLAAVMQNFDRFCLTKHPDAAALTRELATEWCDEGKSAGRSGYKMHAIRLFGKYLQSVGVEAFVMPSAWIGKPIRRAAAHVHRRGVRSVLRCQGKRRKDRLVPADQNLIGLLAKFDRLAVLRRPDREWFFDQASGKPYPHRWLTAQYHRVQAMADGVAPGSTPYTLRHNYATRTMARWVDEGRDLGVWLHYLSAYMGHATYTETAYYIQLLPQRIAATGLTIADGIIPEPPL